MSINKLIKSLKKKIAFKDELAKGLNGDWKKEGYTFIHDEHLNMHRIRAIKNKKQVGTYYFRQSEKDPSTAHVMDSNTDVSHQRKGLASAAYDLFQKNTGMKLKQRDDTQSDDAKALWAQPNHTFGKSDDLEKGVARKIAPYNPENDHNTKNSQGWVIGEEQHERDLMPRMEGAARFRGLNKIRGATQTRINPATKEREYLLHRGMGDNEKHDPEPGRTSWTPNYRTAIDFASKYGMGDGDEPSFSDSHVVSSWVPESKIHAFPFMHGNTEKMRKFRDEFEVVVNPHQLNIHSVKSPTEAKASMREAELSQEKPLNDLYLDNGTEFARRKMRGNLGKSDSILQKSPELTDYDSNPNEDKHSIKRNHDVNLKNMKYRESIDHENHKIHYYSNNENNSHYFTITHDETPNGNPISVITLDGVPGGSKKFGHPAVNVGFTHPDYQQRGLYGSLMRGVTKKLGRIQSDISISPNAHKAWVNNSTHPNMDVRLDPDMKNTDTQHSATWKQTKDDLEKSGDIEFHHKDNNGTHSVTASINGRIVGHYKFDDSDGFLMSEGAVTHPDFRKMGIASAAYRFLEQKTGKQITPAGQLTGDGKKFWSQKNRDFGAGFVNPKFVAGSMDSSHYTDEDFPELSGTIGKSDLAKSFHYKGTLYPETTDPEGLPHHTQPWVKTTTTSGAPTWSLRPDLARAKEREMIQNLQNFKKNNHLSEKGNQLITTLAEKTFNHPDRHAIRGSGSPENPQNNPEIRLRHLNNVLKGANGYGVTENDGKIHIWADRHSGQGSTRHHWTFDGENTEFHQPTFKLAKSTGNLAFKNMLPGEDHPEQDIMSVKTPNQFKMARKLAEQTVPKEVRGEFANKVHEPLDHMETKDTPNIATRMTRKYGGTIDPSSIAAEGVTYKDDTGGKAFVTGEEQSHTIRNHEAIHHIFNKIAAKYGDDVHDQIRDHLLKLVHPEDRQAIHGHIARIGYHPSTFDDEVLPHMYEIMNNPAYRNTFKIMNKKTDEQMHAMVGRMKQSWKAIRQVANNLRGNV